jgi:hypothetical protein
MFRFSELNLAQCSLADTTPACTAASTRARSGTSRRLTGKFRVPALRNESAFGERQGI